MAYANLVESEVSSIFLVVKDHKKIQMQGAAQYML